MSKPLTVEQLKALSVGDWVWIEILDPESVDESFPKKVYFQKADISIGENFFPFILNDCEDGLDYQFYGSDWLAYKNKEQAEAKGEIVELLCRVGDTVYIPWVWEGESDVATLIIECIVMKDDGEDFWLCLDLETDDYEFVIKYRNHLMADYGKTWFTDKSEAERKLAELKGE